LRGGTERARPRRCDPISYDGQEYHLISRWGWGNSDSAVEITGDSIDEPGTQGSVYLPGDVAVAVAKAILAEDLAEEN
jgi:hypothetical protein